MNQGTKILETLGINQHYFANNDGRNSWKGNAQNLEVYSPVDNSKMGEMNTSSEEDYKKIIKTAQAAFKFWRNTPAPKRGEIVRQLGNKLREHKDELGALVSYEMGKSIQEGLGEVQEMIDICDFGAGLSRQLYGLSMHSERPGHRMFEQWHPLGIVGIISAFNFPVAVWSWNSVLALVCGNVCVWKPSEKTPLSAIACQKIFQMVAEENNLPAGISSLVIGDNKVGELITNDQKVVLVSATGSTRMGRIVGQTVAKRFGKTILELGGNNAIIVTQNASLEQAIPAILFGAVGTAGQRCTTTRRIFIHHSIYGEVKTKLTKAYHQVRIGNPLDENNHMGPLIDQMAVENYLNAIQTAVANGGEILFGGKVIKEEFGEQSNYVEPTLIEMKEQFEIVCSETFAPILYMMSYENLQDAIALQNAVPQGLSSAIFSNHISEVQQFLSVVGSDCGIANVNIGTSGAEIGGAFGGEKETGGGRESGSDSWKAYMRRQTCTINYSEQNTLAQGIKFDI